LSRLLFWGVTALVTLLAASFALSNRETVSLELWPLPGAVDAPLYIVIVLSLGIGYLVGRLLAWLSYGSLRSAHRQRGRELARLNAAAPVVSGTGQTTGRQILPT
jgi:uncharacterized integral membrane protein